MSGDGAVVRSRSISPYQLSVCRMSEWGEIDMRHETSHSSNLPSRCLLRDIAPCPFEHCTTSTKETRAQTRRRIDQATFDRITGPFVGLAHHLNTILPLPIPFRDTVLEWREITSKRRGPELTCAYTRRLVYHVTSLGAPSTSLTPWGILL